MPSIVPGFEYDVFISYRQNDNRSGWVTEFVKSLQEELAATIKDPVSIYFDYNPQDGLLENHDVDDSLKIKLKSAILIPIISPTYCDTRSFAWKHEFVAFKTMAAKDPFGLKVKVPSGNVASRILPVCVNDLDADDKQLLEAELGGALRGIEFIYRSAGVVRPLKGIEEDSKANLNHTYYRDQITKVARAIKDILNGLKSSTHTPLEGLPEVSNQPTPFVSRKKLALAAATIGVLGLLSFTYYYFGGFGNRVGKSVDKSIAVLPFENMNRDPEQDYFSNGIAEDILNHLTKVADLQVKSRTSTLQYKGTQKTMKEIGEDLGVANIVEGSVRRVDGKVRIVVQLIDARTDLHLWSETYDRELKDILTLQSEIAMEIANALEARLTALETKNIKQEASQSVTAYDYYLKARQVVDNTNFTKLDFENALLLLNQAIKLDPGFSKALALKGKVWYELNVFGTPEKVWRDSALFYANKSTEANPTSPDGYIVNGIVSSYLGDFAASKENFRKAFEVAPNDPVVWQPYGVQLLREKNEKGADLILKSIENEHSLRDSEYYTAWQAIYYYVGDTIMQEKLLEKAKELNPGSVTPYNALAVLYRNMSEFEKGLVELKHAEKISPKSTLIIDQLAWLSFMNNDLKNAELYWSKYVDIESTFEDSTQIIPFRSRLGMVYAKMGRKKEADELFTLDMNAHEEILSDKRGMGGWDNYGSLYYALAVDNAHFGNQEKAVQYLDSAVRYEFNWDWGYYNDPMLASLRKRADFKKVIKKLDDYNEFLRMAFSKAINRAESSKQLKSILK